MSEDLTREDRYGVLMLLVVVAGLVMVRSHEPVCAGLPDRVDALEQKVKSMGEVSPSRKGSGFVGKLGKDGR